MFFDSDTDHRNNVLLLDVCSIQFSQAHTQRHTHVYTHADIFTHTRTHTHTHTHNHVCECASARTHTHTLTHTHTHTHMHTHTHSHWLQSLELSHSESLSQINLLIHSLSQPHSPIHDPHSNLGYLLIL